MNHREGDDKENHLKMGRKNETIVFTRNSDNVKEKPVIIPFMNRFDRWVKIRVVKPIVI